MGYTVHMAARKSQPTERRKSAGKPEHSTSLVD
jgi:hypothetical protein